MPWLAEDLTGRTFGKLTALYRGPNAPPRRVRWFCRCTCGKQILVATNDLKSGHTVSCGCVRIQDLTGQTFGKLTVLRLAFCRKKSAHWLCRCQCGNEITIRRANLLSGNNKACGCEHFHDLTGRVFGMLIVIRRAPNHGRRTRWICRCSCGSPEKEIGADFLVDGRTISCGCHRAEAIGNRRRTHGKTGTRDYRIWHNMKRRCQDPDNPAYPNYGGRGINVAPEFQTYEGFIAYMGPSNGLTLDRIDNNGSYVPGNVRWADRKTQARNKRTSYLITFEGKTQTLAAWAADLGLNSATLRERLGCWPLAAALTAAKGSRVENVRGEVFTKPQARRILRGALRNGKITPKPCEVCGELQTQGHHTDYSKPLDVQWLCRKHHAVVHRASPNPPISRTKPDPATGRRS